MKFQGAVIKEQGVTFAIIIVKRQIIQCTNKANDTILNFRPLFSRIPIVLMAQDVVGKPSFYGRKDIVNFLSKVHIGRIPWKEYRC
jgi:hypothetical protein